MSTQDYQDQTNNTAYNLKKLLRFITIFRILIFWRLQYLVPAVQQYIYSFKFEFITLRNTLLIFLIILFIYSIAGCNLFKYTYKGETINEQYTNFKNVLYGMLTLFKCSTVDDWAQIMYDCSKSENCKPGEQCASFASIPYFISFVLITKYIFMNLIALLILQIFEIRETNPLNPQTFFYTNLNKFKIQYCYFLAQKNIKKITLFHLIGFLRFINHPLGIEKQGNYQQLLQRIKKLTVFTHNNQEIDFNELLYFVFKSFYVHQQFFEMPLRNAYELYYQEKELHKKFLDRQQMKEMNMLRHYKISRFRTKQHEDSNLLEVTGNRTIKKQFLVYHILNLAIIFKSWQRFSQIVKKHNRGSLFARHSISFQSSMNLELSAESDYEEIKKDIIANKRYSQFRNLKPLFQNSINQ